MQNDKTKLIIITLIVLIFVVAIGGTFLYFTTDILKPKQLLFQKYISQNFENISYVFDVSKEEQNVDLLRKSDYTETSNGTLKYLEDQNDEEEVYDITGKAINKASKKEFYRNVSASYGDNLLMSVDLLGQNDTYGFRIANLVEQFVSVENETMPYFISSLGLDGKSFQETLKGVDISGLALFSAEEVSQLENSYINLILGDMDKSHFSAKKNAVITLANKESITTNAYTLTVTKNELDNLYKKILNQAMNDQIILNKIQNIDDKISEAGFSASEGESLKDQYISYIQSIIDGIEYQGEDSREYSVTVYERKGNTVRTLVKAETAEYTLDLDDSDGKTMSLKIKEIIDDEEKTRTYSIGKTENNESRKRTLAYSDDNQSCDINLNTVQNDSEINVETKLNYKNDKISNIGFESKTNIKLGTNDEIPVNFEERNNIILNDYDIVKIVSILDSLKSRVITSLQNSQNVINTKMLNNILVKIDKQQQKLIQEQQNDLELKKDRFNNRFVLYEGENVEKEYVLKLIKTVGENLEDYQLISGTQIKMIIKEGSKNEQKANEIATAVEASRDTYNVKLNYNDEGYVESIDLTVYEKK